MLQTARLCSFGSEFFHSSAAPCLGIPVFENWMSSSDLRPRGPEELELLSPSQSRHWSFSDIGVALLRALTLDCGCFGSGTPSRPRMWMDSDSMQILFCGSVFAYLKQFEGRLSEIGGVDDKDVE
jgi:hypothetical protein